MRPRSPALGGLPPPHRLARSARWAAAPRRPPGIALGERALRVLADALHVPAHVREDAERAYHRAHAAGLTRGRRIELVCAACLLEACRDRGIPRTLHEAANAAVVDPAELGRMLRALASERRTRVLPAGPIRLLPAIASRAGAPAIAVASAAAILRAANVTGRRPEPLAAAALALACRRIETRVGVGDLAKAAGVSRQAVYDAIAALSAR